MNLSRHYQNASFLTVFSKLFALVCTAISFGLLVLGGPRYEEWGSVAFFITVSSSALLVVLLRNNALLFIISFVIALTNWSAASANYLHEQGRFDTMYAHSSYGMQGLLILAAFTSLLVLLLPSKVFPYSVNRFRKGAKNKRYQSIFCTVIGIFLIIIFLTCSSGFARDGRGLNNSGFEYSYILFVAGLFIAGDNKFCRNLLIAIAFLFIIQAVFFAGNRAAILGIVLLLVFLVYGKNLTWTRLIVPVFIFMFLLMAMGYYRNTDEFFLFKFFDAVEVTIRDLFVWDTASFSFIQSIAFIRLEQILPSEEHLYYLQQFFLSFILGGSKVPDSAISIVAQSWFPGMGGGILPFYGFFYFGWPGCALCSVIVAFWIRMINSISESISSFKMLVTYSVAFAVFRWYIYSPSPFTSGLLIATVVCFLTVVLTENLRDGKRSESNINFTEQSTHTI